MTRDIDWGIPVPLDDPDAAGKVLYVWFDAPIGYVSNTMKLCVQEGGAPEDYTAWWKDDDTEIYHFIGEDNTIFHCVIWIAMLNAEGSFSLPTSVVVNQFLNLQGASGAIEKFSKSRGNAIALGDYLAEGNDPDMMRYYLTAIAPEKARTIYNPLDLVQRNNTDLANTIGNFVNRIVSFTIKYYGTEVPSMNEARIDDVDRTFSAAMDACVESVTDLLEGCHFKAALETTMEFCRACNRYIDEKAPWVSRKTDEELTKVSLYHGLQAIQCISVLLSPFIPGAAEKMQRALSMDPEQVTWESARAPLKAGTPLEKPELLFKKIELAED